MTAPNAAAKVPPAVELRELAQQVAHLLPDRRDPHRFHESKSEVVAALRRLSRTLDRAGRA
ncbi:MAG: hypothetical protein NVS2B11_05490 [Acetobacteraceae bacterium]